MRWAPSGLPPIVQRLAEAIERRFALRAPDQPVRRPIIAQSAALPPASEYEGADVYVRDVGGGVAVMAFSDGANWRRCDTLGIIA